MDMETRLSADPSGDLNGDLDGDLNGDPGSDPNGNLGGTNLQSLRLWLRLLSCTTLIETEIRTRLRSEFDTTLPRFDLMAQLERHPDGLRMGELSKRMMVTGANITGITDQLEQENLVQRIADNTDRRVYSVKLTPHGRASFSAMAAQHETWVAELFVGLSGEQKSQLYDLLAALKLTALQPKLNRLPASAPNPVRSLS